MRPKILWVSKTQNPDVIVRPNSSEYTLVEVKSYYGLQNPIISKATSYNEFKEALDINNESMFDEICLDFKLDDIHNGLDCIEYLKDYCIENNLDLPRLTVITEIDEFKNEMLSYIEEVCDLLGYNDF